MYDEESKEAAYGGGEEGGAAPAAPGLLGPAGFLFLSLLAPVLTLSYLNPPVMDAVL